MPEMGLNEYARHRGIGDAAVQFALKQGRIQRNENGKIDSDQADQDWEDSTSPSHSLRGQMGGRPPQGEAKTAEPQPKAQQVYMDSRAVREQYAARTAKLDFEAKQKTLVSRQEVNLWLGHYMTILRNACEQIPNRLAGQLAAEQDPDLVYQILDKEIRAIFERFSNGRLEE